jgi:hypothetical protein
MPNRPTRGHRSLAAAAIVFLAAAAGAAQTATTLDGTIAAATPTSATIATKTGSTTVMLNGATRVIRFLPAALADIKVGTFVAVTATKTSGGTLTAVAVTILDALPGTRKGRWPMESGQIMTNMNVVSIVAGKSGRTLRLRYQAQTTSIVVPDTTPVRRVELGDVADLKAGTHVTVRGETDAYGVFTASSITIR